MVQAIIGANWGDEGKGKITDMMAEHSDIVVRFQGGANAGHTIINDYGRFALHLLPSGVCYPHITNIIGNGVAFHVPSFLKELQSLKDGGVPTPKILVSERVQLLMPYHVLQDTYEEERLAGRAFGSTRSGIAPFYSDKYAKIGIQLNELFDEAVLRERLEKIVTLKNVLFTHLYHKPELSVDALFAQLMEWREQIAPYMADTQSFVTNALKEGKTMTEDEVKERVRANMARHKVPSYVAFMETFPMTASGKIQKFKMREWAVEHLGLQQAAAIETA